MNSSQRHDLSGLVRTLVGGREVTASQLREGLASVGVPLSRLATDGLLASLEVRGVLRGRYSTETEAATEDRGARIYRCIEPAAEALRPAA